MSQSFTNLLYHIIFSTKDRRPLIKLDYQPRLYDYIGGIIRGTGGISLGINGVEDHVHVLAKLRPDRALSDVLRDLKANASGWMNDVFPTVCRIFLATWLRSLHGESIKFAAGATLSRKPKGASSKSFV
jgi:REP element-mobilizing transposase RayT